MLSTTLRLFSHLYFQGFLLSYQLVTTYICSLFHKIDKNNDNHILPNELRALILGIQIEEVGLNEDDYEAMVMEEFDIPGDSHITETEFIKGVSKWINKAQHPANNQGHDKPKFSNSNSKVKD